MNWNSKSGSSDFNTHALTHCAIIFFLPQRNANNYDEFHADYLENKAIKKDIRIYDQRYVYY
jgi:hypothetical protein